MRMSFEIARHPWRPARPRLAQQKAPEALYTKPPLDKTMTRLGHDLIANPLQGIDRTEK
jgi:hypothetical protein